MTSAAKRILIAGGGTGGHVYPALAIIENLRSRGSFRFLYVGGKNGVEMKIVPPHQVPMESLWIAGFARSLTVKNLLFPVKLAASLLKSWRIVRKFKPDVAVGTGGYVTGPILYVAAKMGVPVLIQEQDVHPGVTTRLLAGHARRICLAFEGAKAHLRAFANKLVVTGNPVRTAVSQGNRQEAIQRLGLKKDLLTLFIFGGSQGARSINLAMSGMLNALCEQYPLQVLWQTGPGQYDAVIEQFSDRHPAIRVEPYIDRMEDYYAAADVIVCRAGASSLAELALVARAAILVPYPHAAGDHQAHNSRMIAEAGAALMVPEGERWEENLKAALEKLLSNEKLRRQQAEAWQKMARPEAAQAIGDEILLLVKSEK